MAISSHAALWFAPFVWPICLWVMWSDMSRMKILNKAAMALFVVYIAVGVFVLPFDLYLWQLLHLVVVLVAGIALNAAGLIGAGDAKFAAAAAPFIMLGDLSLLLPLFAANIVAAYLTHRLVRATAPLRNLAPEWESWHRGKDFPMGFSLGAMLAIYLGLGIAYGS